jgi:predicted aspartyl protease
MGAFQIECSVANVAERDKTASVSGLLVDTGSELTWLPGETLESIGVRREKKDLTFVMANGSHITRSVGFAIVHVGEAFTVDEVVFAEEGDRLLLGSRSLDGMNLTVDATNKKLVAAGPLPAAYSRDGSVSPSGGDS